MYVKSTLSVFILLWAIVGYLLSGLIIQVEAKSYFLGVIAGIYLGIIIEINYGKKCKNKKQIQKRLPIRKKMQKMVRNEF